MYLSLAPSTISISTATTPLPCCSFAFTCEELRKISCRHRLERTIPIPPSLTYIHENDEEAQGNIQEFVCKKFSGLMDTKTHPIRILMLPWLAYGHISPYLELGKQLAKRNFQVYLCSTPANLTHFRKNLEEEDNGEYWIHFVDLHLPLNSELSLGNQTTKNLPPNLIATLMAAFDDGKDDFRNILREIKPHLVIYDFLQHWAPVVAEEENIPAVHFITGGAAATSYLYHCILKPDSDFPIAELDFPITKVQQAVRFIYYVTNGLMNKQRVQQAVDKSSNFILIRSFDGTEQKYVDYISTLFNLQVIPVGPLIGSLEDKYTDSPFIDWLDKRDAVSTVFVSFGTECFLSREEIKEIALGLELSMVNFIWVIRFHAGENLTNLDDVLPQGYQQRVGERGLVVKGWAPQVKILSHPGVGGFISHCGWNSILESMACGVPIIAVPMNVDQPFNARFLEGIGVAIQIQREDEKFKKEEIANVINDVIVGEKGKQVRKKVKELSSKMAAKGDQKIDHAVKKLMQLVE